MHRGVGGRGESQSVALASCGLSVQSREIVCSRVRDAIPEMTFGSRMARSFWAAIDGPLNASCASFQALYGELEMPPPSSPTTLTPALFPSQRKEARSPSYIWTQGKARSDSPPSRLWFTSTPGRHSLGSSSEGMPSGLSMSLSLSLPMTIGVWYGG